MNRQQTRILLPIRRENLFELKHQYEYRKDRKFKSLQKVCFGVLRKIGAFAQEARLVDLQYFEPKPEKLCDAIVKQHRHVLEQCGYEENCRLLIGNKTYYDLINEEMLDISYPINFNLEFGYSNGRVNMYRGLEVWLIPWMEGLVVVTEKVLYHHSEDRIKDLEKALKDAHQRAEESTQMISELREILEHKR